MKEYHFRRNYSDMWLSELLNIPAHECHNYRRWWVNIESIDNIFSIFCEFNDEIHNIWATHLEPYGFILSIHNDDLHNYVCLILKNK